MNGIEALSGLAGPVLPPPERGAVPVRSSGSPFQQQVEAQRAARAQAVRAMDPANAAPTMGLAARAVASRGDGTGQAPSVQGSPFPASPLPAGLSSGGLLPGGPLPGNPSLVAPLPATTDARLHEACLDMEAWLWSWAFRQVQAGPSRPGGLFVDSSATGGFRDMLAVERGKQMAHSGSRGLGEMLYQELSRRMHSSAEPTSEPTSQPTSESTSKTKEATVP